MIRSICAAAGPVADAAPESDSESDAFARIGSAVFKNGKLQRSKKAPMTRGLNRNHNPLLKAVFKGAATAAASAPGPPPP